MRRAEDRPPASRYSNAEPQFALSRAFGGFNSRSSKLNGMSFRVAILLLPCLAWGQQIDLLLRGGQVIDGSGSAPRIADVGIRKRRDVTGSFDATLQLHQRAANRPSKAGSSFLQERES